MVPNLPISWKSVCIAFVVVCAFFAYLQLVKREPLSASHAIARNSENDFLLTRSPVEQAELLGRADGEGCKGTYAFFMGIDERKNGYWSLRCADGREFFISLYPSGSHSAVDCKLLKSMRTGRSCFSPLRRPTEIN